MGGGAVTIIGRYSKVANLFRMRPLILISSVAEWSMAVDLSYTIERCVGSNPTASIIIYFFWQGDLRENLANYETTTRASFLD